MIIELNLVEDQDSRTKKILLNVLQIKSIRAGLRGTSISMVGDICLFHVKESIDEVQLKIKEVLV